MLNDTLMQRLAFIKYLYSLGVDQSYQPEPQAGASILALHDAIELFLDLACEHLSVKVGDSTFMQYWELLTPKLQPQGLSQCESMRRLNKSRVSLKHHGTMPSKLDIESFRATVVSFFEENTQTVFNVKFADISLQNLVASPTVRAALDTADSLIKQGKLEDALDKICVGFHQLLDEYESTKVLTYSKSPFTFGSRRSFRRVGGNSELDTTIDAISESLEEIQNAMRILALGLDYRRYLVFHALSPLVHKLLNGTYSTQRYPRESPLAKEECHFCFDFVIECALRLQQFDFEIITDSPFGARRLTKPILKGQDR